MDPQYGRVKLPNPKAGVTRIEIVRFAEINEHENVKVEVLAEKQGRPEGHIATSQRMNVEPLKPVREVGIMEFRTDLALSGHVFLRVETQRSGIGQAVVSLTDMNWAGGGTKWYPLEPISGPMRSTSGRAVGIEIAIKMGLSWQAADRAAEAAAFDGNRKAWIGTWSHPKVSNGQENQIEITLDKALPGGEKSGYWVTLGQQSNITASAQGARIVFKDVEKGSRMFTDGQVLPDGKTMEGSVMEGRNMMPGGKFRIHVNEDKEAQTPMPLDLALLSLKGAGVQQDPAYVTWATKHGEYKPPKPRSLSDIYWYRAQNNWGAAIAEMEASLWQAESRPDAGTLQSKYFNVEPRFLDNVANGMYDMSGGKLGVQWDQAIHMKQEEVAILFEDYEWQYPKATTAKKLEEEGKESKEQFLTRMNSVWCLPGQEAWVEEDQMRPVVWKRLWDDHNGPPYPEPDMGANNPNPLSGRIYQGHLEDGYFVQACYAISMKSKLVADIFVDESMQAWSGFPTEGLGFYNVRFYQHGQWTSVKIDDFLPYGGKGDELLCCRAEGFPSVAWPSLVEKAYAKLNGSWMSLSDKGGDVEEVMVDLTGGCAGRFSTTDVAGDRMWKYFNCLEKTTIWACTISTGECMKRTIPIAGHYASAVYTTKMVKGVPYVGVFTCAPFSSVKHFPLNDIEMEEGYDYHDGFMWLRIDDFAQLFDRVYECRLVNTFHYSGRDELNAIKIKEPIPIPPGRPPMGWPPQERLSGNAGGIWHEWIYAYRGTVDMENEPNFLLDVPDDTEVILDMSQPSLRCMQAASFGDSEVDERRICTGLGMDGEYTYDEMKQHIIQTAGGAVDEGQIDDYWKTCSPASWDATSYTREPQAPVLLRFYQCSREMETSIRTVPKVDSTFKAGAGNPAGLSDELPRNWRKEGTKYINTVSGEVSYERPRNDWPYIEQATCDAGELYLVHMSSWCHSRDSMCAVKVLRRGRYVASATMPSAYSVPRMIFRSYSNREIGVRFFKMPRSCITVNPGMPLRAIPNSLTGLPRIDAPEDNLPQVFDEDEGVGKRGGKSWEKKLQKEIEKDFGIKEGGGPKVVGTFGGADANATMYAKEGGGGGGDCSIM